MRRDCGEAWCKRNESCLRNRGPESQRSYHQLGVITPNSGAIQQFNLLTRQQSQDMWARSLQCRACLVPNGATLSWSQMADGFQQAPFGSSTPLDDALHPSVLLAVTPFPSMKLQLHLADAVSILVTTRLVLNWFSSPEGIVLPVRCRLDSRTLARHIHYLRLPRHLCCCSLCAVESSDFSA